MCFGCADLWGSWDISKTKHEKYFVNRRGGIWEVGRWGFGRLIGLNFWIRSLILGNQG
jgi:hypothetical protein